MERNLLRSGGMSRKLLVGMLFVTAATLGLVFTVGRRPRVYSIDVAELVGQDIRDQQARVGGALVRGTLCRVEPDCGYRFTLRAHDRWSSNGTPLPESYAELPVSFAGCVVPETLRDVGGLDVLVVVEGERCQSCHDFVASKVFAKSAMKYEIDPDSGRPLYAVSRIPLCKALAPRM